MAIGCVTQAIRTGGSGTGDRLGREGEVRGEGTIAMTPQRRAGVAVGVVFLACAVSRAGGANLALDLQDIEGWDVSTPSAAHGSEVAALRNEPDGAEGTRIDYRFTAGGRIVLTRSLSADLTRFAPLDFPAQTTQRIPDSGM